MLVKNLILTDRNEIPVDKLSIFDWYCNLEAELVEFGYLVKCECGDTCIGYAVNAEWIEKHFNHKNTPNPILEWLDNEN